MTDIVSQVKSKARELGFSNLGIVPARPSPRLDAFLHWIRAGMHGEMNYLARSDRVARRQDLNHILPGAKSLIIAGLDYFSLRLPPTIANDPLRGRISNYAWNADYHEVMLRKLDTLTSFIRGLISGDAFFRAHVDTGAILERDHAEAGGLGFIGKNTMLIDPSRGSFFFLGEILTTVDMPFDDPPAMPTCGICTRCLTACPTSAFPEPYILDARQCISYLTIELKGTIPVHVRPTMGNWVYGCDVCQDVCPWQRFAKPAEANLFAPESAQTAAPMLTDLLSLKENDFSERFGRTAVARVGRNRLVRNACVAAGNSKSAVLASYLIRLLEDQSELVRGHAAWALGQIHLGRAELRRALLVETDTQVREELLAAINQV